MPRLHRARATLRIMGDDLQPDEVSVLLGARPSKAHSMNQELTLASGRSRIAKFGLWSLTANDTEPENFDSQVAEICAQLTNDLTVWHALSRRFEIDLFCGWFMNAGNEGVEISPETMLALGQRGIQLGLDIYGADSDE